MTQSKRKHTARQSAPVPVQQGMPALVAQPGRLLTHPLAHALLIAVVGVLAYHNSFAGVFLFDDEHAVLENPRLQQLWPIAGWGELLWSGWLVEWTFQINRALDGLTPWGYHLVNLVIHVLAGLTLYGLVRRTLLLLPRYQTSASSLALAVALLWLVHPLQTESVTYLVQRSESLMGLFYLLTLYCTLRGATADRQWPWYAVAVLCCLLGMASKEVMCTAPLLVLLFDRAFLAGSFRQGLRQRGGLYLGLCSCWLLLTSRLLALFSQAPDTAGVGFQIKGLSAWQYAASQPGVLLHYLRLAFWPDRLCLDYGWPVAATTEAVVLPALLLGLLLAATLWAWRHWPGLGFCGACFFLVLLPTSSIVPLQDLAFEHRLYLPLAAVVVVVVLAAEALLAAWGRSGADQRSRVWCGAMAAATLVAVLVALTVRRNGDYRSPVVMWQSVVDQYPNNARAHANLGWALLDQRKPAQAETSFREAIRLWGGIENQNPRNARAHVNLGMALLGQRKPAQAEASFREAIRLNPTFALAYHHLGFFLSRQGKTREAIAALREAVHLAPNDTLGHYNLGIVLSRAGKLDEAARAYREVLRLDPDIAGAHVNLAGVLMSQGEPAEAIPHFREALRLEPALAPNHNNLGLALLQHSAWREAADCFGRAVELQPRQAGYHRNLAFAQHHLGRTDQARAEYHSAETLEPGWTAAVLRQAWELATHPDPARRDGRLAALMAEQALQANGEDPEALNVLAATRAELGEFKSAAEAARRGATTARQKGRADLARQIDARLTLYLQHKPFRAVP